MKITWSNKEDFIISIESPAADDGFVQNPIVIRELVPVQVGSLYREELTISSNGQTSFNLLHISSLPHLSQLSFNGVLQKLGTDYVINSSVLTWSSSIPVSTTDTLIIYYS